MNAKIQKISSEIEKTKAKISEFQTKLKELEKQKTEFENADIIDAVRGSDITLTDLAAILKKGRGTSGQVGPKLATTKNDENKEETDQ
ncbi:MAG: DUF4315 family protein [Oscillospiraceae bacterium]|nr:DUF4315 family protein [Oscillospiraceae bacterium]